MKKLLVLTLLLNAFLARAGKVTGTITDKAGDALEYSSIFIKGSSKGTNANSEGKYQIHLDPGQYTIICQHVGYKREEKQVTVGDADLVIDFSLSAQDMTMPEVVLTIGQNPALEIMRNAIKKRSYYQDQLRSFQCEVYTKGQLRVRSYPKKFLGKTLNLAPEDTSQKMLYLSETISTYAIEPPHRARIVVHSSKVSGKSDGYGLSAPQFYSLYDNNVFINNSLNPRGFISPIAENAMKYYTYKYQGTFYEDGKQINKIKVIPKRKFEPLFSGYINIVEDEWRIHSLQLFLTRQNQLQLVDSMRIEQLYRRLNADSWVMSSQILYPSISFMGFDAYGSFLNIYSDFQLNPEFPKNTFSNTVLKFNDSANKKTPEFWEAARPVPLHADEISDYHYKDSLETLNESPRYRDSLQKLKNRLSIFGMILTGQTFFEEQRRSTFTLKPLTEQISFNIVEGLVVNTGFTWTKRLDTLPRGRRSITLEPNFRYGFLNKHFNAHLKAIYTFGTRYASSVSLSGGKRVFQYNSNSPIGPRSNTLSSLLGENNRLKIYEAWYLRGSYTKGIGHGFTWTAGFQYQDRIPEENNTDYTWRDLKDRSYTPNFPNDLVSQNFLRHQAFMILLRMNWQPGTRYIELPDQRINIGSKYPVFAIEYVKGIPDFLGSDEKYSKWKFTIRNDLNLKMAGRFSYRLGFGGFFDHSSVQVPDYNHFNGNQSTFATQYLNSFQLLPIYQFSNTADFYGLMHLEHNFNGLLTNKIPGIRSLNLYLVVGGNGFVVRNGSNYFEYFVGIDNIFKRFRIDFVTAYLDGKAFGNGIRIGLGGPGRMRADDWP